MELSSPFLLLSPWGVGWSGGGGVLHRPQVAEARPWAARSPAEAGGAMRWDRRCVGRRFCGQAGEAGNGVKEEGWSRVLRGAAGADVSPQHPAVLATSLGVLQSPRVPWRNTPSDYKAALAHKAFCPMLSSFAFVTFSSAVGTCVAPCHQWMHCPSHPEQPAAPRA